MLNRRDFLKFCAGLSMSITGASMLKTDIAHGFSKLLLSEKPKICFLQGQSCTGCTISLTYGNETSFIDFINVLINLQVHPSLSSAQGKSYTKQMDELHENGDYIVVTEGSVPLKLKSACMIGGVPYCDYIEKFLKDAKAVVVSGTCASFGGIPASGNNPSGSVSIPEYMKQKGIETPYILIPGCPVQPDRLIGTVAYMVHKGGFPDMDKHIPIKYYPSKIHDNCQRFQHFNQGIYLEKYEEDSSSCLMKKGCRGTITYADCPTRRWNGKVNVCIESNSPCVGCINSSWPFNSPLYLPFNEVEDIPWEEMKRRVKEFAR